MASGEPATKVPKTVEDYYYFVNINCPFLARSAEQLDEKLESAKDANKLVRIDGGSFTLISNWYGRERYFVYKFKHSIGANRAQSSDFAYLTRELESDEIFPKAEHPTISIDFEFITVTGAHAAAKSAAKSAATATAAAAESAFTSVLKSIRDEITHENAPGRESLVEIIDKKVSDMKESPLQPPALPVQRPESDLTIYELTKNQHMCESIKREAENMGYIVTTNVSGPKNAQLSGYYSSRPDLVIYKENCGYIVRETTASEELDDDATTTAAALSGGITENKNTAIGDDIGQLLGGMEKLAGDLAHQHLRHLHEAKERAFQQIIIYGLVITFVDLKCKPYKLTMNFINSTCVLDAGRQKLNLSDGISRLISKLEQTTA